MDDPILFNPDNRLLGGAVGDLSLYGGQSDPKFSVQEAREGAPSSLEAANGASGATPTGPAGQDLAASSGAVQGGLPSEHADSGAGSLAPVSFLITAPAAFEPVAVPTAFAPAGSPAPIISSWQLNPQGAGSITPATLAPAATPADIHNDGAGQVFLGTAASLLDDLAEATPNVVSGVVAPVTEAAGTVVAGTVDTVGDTVGTVLPGTAETLDDTVGTLLQGTTETVGDTVETLLQGTTENVGDTVGTLVQGATETVGDTVGTLLQGTADTVDGGVGTLLHGTADAVDGGIGTLLHSTVGAADDTLEGLSGSDPLGGVATLVSLISISDTFDLNPVNAVVPDATSGDLGVLDTLVGEDLLPDTLLGSHHDDGGLGDHLPHDNPLGL